jgi:hypothetical protein
MDKKTRKRIQVLKDRLRNRRNRRAAALKQPDEPDELEQLDQEIAALKEELRQFQGE